MDATDAFLLDHLDEWSNQPIQRLSRQSREVLVFATESELEMGKANGLQGRFYDLHEDYHSADTTVTFYPEVPIDITQFQWYTCMYYE